MRDEEARRNSVDALTRVSKLERQMDDQCYYGLYAPGINSRLEALEQVVKLLLPVGYEVVDVRGTPPHKELRKKDA